MLNSDIKKNLIIYFSANPKKTLHCFKKGGAYTLSFSLYEASFKKINLQNKFNKFNKFNCKLFITRFFCVGF
jgi:hypothetical protein